MTFKTSFFLFAALTCNVKALSPVAAFHSAKPSQTHSLSKSSICSTTQLKSSNAIEVDVFMPPSNSGLQAQMKINPILDVPSEIIEVRYRLPFGLDVAPKDSLAVVTKDGAGGEKVGDILRYTSAWSIGLPQGDGLVSTAAAFSGGVSWQCYLFDVMKAAAWEQVVEALVSNVDTRTDEVVLLFERPLPSE